MLPPLPINETCESYYRGPTFNLSIFFVNYFVSKCLEDAEGIGGFGGTKGVDDFLSVLVNEYFIDSPQIFLLYDESWEISDMIKKLTVTSNKAFVSYFLPVDYELMKRVNTQPPDHISHKRLPKATTFILFVKDEIGFANIIRLMSVYPWWNRRAKVVVMVKEMSLLPIKGILAMMEAEKIFNGVVVTQLSSRDDSQLSVDQVSQQPSKQSQQKQKQKGSKDKEKKEGETEESDTEDDLMLTQDAQTFIDLQVVALDPYPLEGHSKESYVARWANAELLTIRPIFHEKIENLRGHRLHVCVFEFPPLVIKTEVEDGRFTYTGLEVRLLDELARLLNFTFEFFEPPEGQRWGNDLGNNTWNGLIGETQRHADFGFASVFLLDNRERAVDVSTPYDQDQGCFAVPRPEALQHWLGLVLPFSWQVWACIIAMAVVAGPIFAFITRPLGMDKSLTVGRGILFALGSLVSAQKAPQAKSHALRSFIVSWLIFCWLACILYRVALIVSLTVGPSAFKIDTIKQMARSGLEWGGYREVLNSFTNTSDPDDQVLFEKFEIVTNSTEALERVAKEGDFALLDSGKFLKYAEQGKYFDGYSSLIHVAKECPTRYNVGIVMPIGSPFLEKVNELIRRLQNSGIIDKWYDDILHEAAVKNPNRIAGGKKKERGLDIGDLKLCLVLVLVGHFSAFLVLLGEHCLYNYRTGKLREVGSAIIRKVSTVSGLSLMPSTKGDVSGNPSVIITETENDSESESLRSLPVEVEHGWCGCFDENINDPASASLGDIRPVSCPHIKQVEEE